MGVLCSIDVGQPGGPRHEVFPEARIMTLLLIGGQVFELGIGCSHLTAKPKRGTPDAGPIEAPGHAIMRARV